MNQETDKPSPVPDGPVPSGAGAAHTPGPWTADDGNDNYYGVFCAKAGGAICYLVEPTGIITRDHLLPQESAQERFLHDEYQRVREHIANARLIAAAPDMLAALQAVDRDAIASTDPNYVAISGTLFRQVSAAIALALGSKP